MNDMNLTTFASFCHTAFINSQAVHGDLDLSFEVYGNRIAALLEKHCGGDPTPSTLQSFFSRFHLNDLYLSEACAQGSEDGWERFLFVYKIFIQDLCRYCCGAGDRGKELADKVVAELFFPDRSGRSRIGSFDGRVALSSWLDVVVRRKAMDEVRLKDNRCESVDLIEDFVDSGAANRLYTDLRESAYGTLVWETLKKAMRSLSDREQLLLLLKYEKGLRSAEIAVIFGVSASTVSRQLQAIQAKVREFVLATLVDDHGFGEAAIRECVCEAIENPAYSLLSMIATA